MSSVKPKQAKVISWFMRSYFPPILMLLALIAGAAALWLTPREEDPQIVVPMADVFVSAPGLSARQIERQVTEPLERLLKQIDGVEYVYSSSMTDQAMVIVRFKVGEGREDSLVKLYNKLYSSQDLISPAVSHWQIKPVEIDDVPIVVSALYSTDPEQVGIHQLRRIAEQASHHLQAVDNTNRVSVIGGQPREILVSLDTAALASYSTTLEDIEFALGVSNQRQYAGELRSGLQRYRIESGQLLQSAEQLQHLVVSVIDGLPVYLGEVANISDGSDELNSYTWFAPGAASGDALPFDHAAYPAVYIAVAKQKGSNAVWVADEVLEQLASLNQQLPSVVKQAVIRNYGETANAKVGDLVSSLGISILTVVVFVGLFLNWRAALVVGIAIPISYGAALAMDLAFGYSINRVTLFALILALGLIVDDPIASIDNIERYLREKALAKPQAIVAAMGEISSALLMSTLAIVIVFTPMFFITGMMGPYMAPLAFNVPISVVFSTVVAFLITPWLAKKLIKSSPAGCRPQTKSHLHSAYRGLLSPLLKSRRRSWIFLSVIAGLFVLAALLPVLRLVPLKLLPYDNKDEFQVVLNMPASSNLESSNAALSEISRYLQVVPEVVSVSGFVGTASPMDFNGMVRHYFLRQQANQAELRVVLADKQQRSQQSHEIVTRLRDDIQAIADRYQAKIQLVETPPGPPVIATVVAEVYGDETHSYAELQSAAAIVAERLAREPMVREVDTSSEEEWQSWQFVVDQDKAARSGIAVSDINQVIAAANQGKVLGYLALEDEINPTPIRLRLPVLKRNSLVELESLYVRGRSGVAKTYQNGALLDAPQPMVQLAELGQFEKVASEQVIMHKNLRPVVYVYAESVGRVPAEVVADMLADFQAPTKDFTAHEQRSYLNNGGGDAWRLDPKFDVVWSGEGEWKITLDVFRDLGIAYAAALLGVFIVMVLQTGLPAVSGIIMLAIPLTVIGIMPGFWLLNGLGNNSVGAYANPSLFTATAMIGMIALAGIVVRNALVLIEFIHQSLAEGKALKSALIEAGAVRMRPILLTAGTTMLGNIVITLDPIFNGLAWAIIFGIAASTVFTLLVIPVVYHLAYAKHPTHGLPVKQEQA